MYQKTKNKKNRVFCENDEASQEFAYDRMKNDTMKKGWNKSREQGEESSGSKCEADNDPGKQRSLHFDHNFRILKKRIDEIKDLLFNPGQNFF